MSKPIKIVVVGGGTAGWMFAAAVSTQCPASVCNVVLVESESIGTVGVGEATQPHMREFNSRIGISEADLVREVNATFKLGICFKNWGAKGDSYIHPFGTYGKRPSATDFVQHWAKAYQAGQAGPLSDYSLATQACNEGKFEFPAKDPTQLNSTYGYAYHFDAGNYVQYLRKKFEGTGVTRIEGKITQVIQDEVTEHVTSLRLESGAEITGDYFIDCSGFRALLFEQTYQIPLLDWSHWLTADRALALPSEGVGGVLTPYTTATAHKVGWQWRIPLQNRVGNGYVYSSEFISDDEAHEQLISGVDGEPLSDAKLIRFKTGCRQVSWHKNCVAVGLSAGFLEPLESTSLYLIQMAISNFIEFFPGKNVNKAVVDAFNRNLEVEYQRVRDFIILHYHLTQRDDSAFWKYCKSMSVPESLTQKIELFSRRGFIDAYKFGAFPPNSWISVLWGQGITPKQWNPLIGSGPAEQVVSDFENMAHCIQQSVQAMPTHKTFLDSLLAAEAKHD